MATMTTGKEGSGSMYTISSEEGRCGLRQIWGLALDLTFSYHVILGKSLSFSEPQFLHL